MLAFKLRRTAFVLLILAIVALALLTSAEPARVAAAALTPLIDVRVDAPRALGPGDVVTVRVQGWASTWSCTPNAAVQAGATATWYCTSNTGKTIPPVAVTVPARAKGRGIGEGADVFQSISADRPLRVHVRGWATNWACAPTTAFRPRATIPWSCWPQL